jgi:hypothetical protein
MNGSRLRRPSAAWPISLAVASLAVATLAGACAGSPSPTPIAVVDPTPVGGSSPPAPTASVSSGPTSSPEASVAPSVSPAPSPDRTPISIPGCPTTSRAGRVPSDTLRKVSVTSDFGVDRITFTFGPAGPQPGGAPTGEVKPARPPFYAGASGNTVSIAGHRFIQITFRQMTIADDAGKPVFTGKDDLHPNAPAVKELRELEEFEGVVTWVAGVEGPGCVRVSRQTAPDRIVVEVEQP